MKAGKVDARARLPGPDQGISSPKSANEDGPSHAGRRERQERRRGFQAPAPPSSSGNSSRRWCSGPAHHFELRLGRSRKAAQMAGDGSRSRVRRCTRARTPSTAQGLGPIEKKRDVTVAIIRRRSRNAQLVAYPFESASATGSRASTGSYNFRRHTIGLIVSTLGRPAANLVFRAVGGREQCAPASAWRGDTH